MQVVKPPSEKPDEALFNAAGDAEDDIFAGLGPVLKAAKVNAGRWGGGATRSGYL